MRRQLCFLIPDLRRASLVLERLRKMGISDERIMIVAKEDTPIDDPPTNIEKTDFYPGLERGLAIGGVLGAIAGLVVMRLTPLGLVLGGAALPLLTLIGAGVSGFMTALAGASFPNSRLTQFEDAVKRGEILIVVDTAQDEIGRIEEIVRQTHAEVEFVGVEPRAPVFPS